MGAIARRPPRAVFRRPPNAASMRGIDMALQALYGSTPPMPADEQAQRLRDLEHAQDHKSQGDLALVLPEAAHE